MKIQISFSLAVFALALSSITGAAEPQTSTVHQPKTFTVFDNFFYAGKPDTASHGLVNCNIIYKGHIVWKENLVPDQAAFEALVRKRAAKPGPIVIDIEYVHDYKLFLNLVKWSHEAVPGCVVGYYGHGLFPEQPTKAQAAEAKELAAALDAFFPSMYTFNDNKEAWKEKLSGLVRHARHIAPGKPVYPYIWPQYHEGTPKAKQFVSGDYWTFQLETARQCGADGVVIWSSNKPAWNDKADWWQATLKFIDSKPTVENLKVPASQKGNSDFDDKKKYGD